MPFFEHPAFAPLTIIWGSILLLVFIVMFFKYLGRRSKYRMIERLAEKGTTLTPEMLSGLTNGNGNGGGHADKNPVSSGIFLMCIGFALALFFWAMQGGGIPLTDDHWLAVIGIFPFMVGLARVLGARAERKDSEPK